MPISIRKLLHEAGFEQLPKCLDVVNAIDMIINPDIADVVLQFIQARWIDWDGQIVVTDLSTWLSECPECECYVFDPSEILFSCVANVNRHGVYIECVRSPNLRDLTNNGQVSFAISSANDIDRYINENESVKLKFEAMWSVLNELARSITSNIEFNIEFFVFETEPHLMVFDIDIVQPKQTK